MAASNVCFYVGTIADFTADSASAASALGNYYPGNSGYATLNAAMTAGAIPTSCTPTAFRENVLNATVATTNLSGSQTKSGYLWTFCANGVV